MYVMTNLCSVLTMVVTDVLEGNVPALQMFLTTVCFILSGHFPMDSSSVVTIAREPSAIVSNTANFNVL